jgi:hypothetical protein
MAKADFSIEALVGKIERGELQLPEMQREYVWRATRVRDLLDSLYRGYPSGVILAWESDEVIATRDFAVEAISRSGVRPLLLLDGQQRLTSLSAILRGKPVSVKGRRKPVDILFNLDHPEAISFVTDVYENSEEIDNFDDSAELDIQERFKRMTFVVASKALLSQNSWVSVSEIFAKQDFEILRNLGLTNMEDPRVGKYSARLQAVRAIAKYEYRMDILERSKSYEEVTEIFVRVNSLGAKLRSSDLALAQITAKWRGSLELFRGYQKDVEKMGFVLDLGIMLRVLVSLNTNQSKFLAVNSLSFDALKSGWDKAKRAFDFALNFTKSEIGIESEALLSSPYVLVATAYWADKRAFSISTQEKADFRKWFLLANAKGRYSRGSSETLLDQDLATLRDGGNASELLIKLKQQVGRLAFTSEDLVGRNSRSGAFKTMFLAFSKDGASDWKTSLPISAKHGGKSDVIEFHHIFPRAYLKRDFPFVATQQIDDIANLAFIGAETNKKISDKPPRIYRTFFNEADLGIQLVDFSNGLDVGEEFLQFLSARRAQIAKKLNEFLSVATTD